MTPHLFLYVILTLTPPSVGHCGQEVTAPSYSPVRMEATDFRLDALGNLINRHPIIFPAPKQRWGIIEGFCILDESRRVIAYGEMTADKRIDASDPALDLDVVIPPGGVERMKDKLSSLGYWWVR